MPGISFGGGADGRVNEGILWCRGSPKALTTCLIPLFSVVNGDCADDTAGNLICRTQICVAWMATIVSDGSSKESSSHKKNSLCDSIGLETLHPCR